MLVPMPELLGAARAGGYAVGYFESWDLYSLEAVVEAAQAERSPVILGFGCAMVDEAWLDRGGIEDLACLGRRAAERCSVPASLLFNEAHTVEQARRALEAGFNAGMVDTCALHGGEARQIVGDFALWAHGRGAGVEAELGQLPNSTDGGTDHSQASLTEPDDAALFVEATGVDCLAVSAGNVHLLEGAEAPLDVERLKAIAQSTNVPLVLHGGTGLPRAALPAAIAAGVAKINVGTGLKRVYLEALRRAVSVDASPHDLLGSHKDLDACGKGKEAMTGLVRELMRAYGSSGRG